MVNWPDILAAASVVTLTLLWLFLAIAATRLVLALRCFEPWQRRVQLLIIWFFPILGASLVFAILAPEVRVRRPGVSFVTLLLWAAFVSSYSHGSELPQGDTEHSGSLGSGDSGEP